MTATFLMSRSLVVPVALLALTVGTLLVVLAGMPGAVRVLLVFAFLAIAPGWPIVRLADPPLGTLGRLALGVALSISLDMLIATALLYLRVWSAELALVIVALVVVLGVVVDLPPTRAVVLRNARAVWSALGTGSRP